MFEKYGQEIAREHSADALPYNHTINSTHGLIYCYLGFLLSTRLSEKLQRNGFTDKSKLPHKRQTETYQKTLTMAPSFPP